MQFNSSDFMIFFPVVLMGYFVIPKKAREVWLLLASYFFYMSWNPLYALLIGGSTVVTYGSALTFDRLRPVSEKKAEGMSDNAKRNIVLILCLLINLGILFVFKYGNFFIDSLNGFLKLFHCSLINRRFDFLLPVGISFYTFQALGYMIDVYRGDVEVEKNFIRYALFVSFFPQLVAGPIERSENLLNQMRHTERIRLWDPVRISSGAVLMVWGFFMKMVIADRVAILVDTVFDHYLLYGSVELILAALGFSLQIYCDFGSYSMIAIGAAKVLGFQLMENFSAPYLARSVKDFWGRWHISLSTWFRDYLYIPLGGNRKGRIRKNVNLMIVFLVSGLWHGANWNFVAWGGIHGVYQVLGDLLKDIRRNVCERLSVKTECFSWKLLQTVCTFCLVVFAWIFFRADSVTDACRYIQRILMKPNPWLLFNGGIYQLGLDRVEMNILVFSICLLVLTDMVRYFRKQTIDAFLAEQNLWFEWFVLISLIVMIFVFGEYGPAFDPQQFIYFQF